jgi:polyadenylate-binding protein
MAPPSSGGPPQFASLYVGDLNPDVTEAMLYEIFNAVGPVGSIRVCRDRVSRRSLGYAYVNFHNVSDAERALDTLNYSMIKGRSCRLMWSQRDASVRKDGKGNVYVKNLDPNIDNKGLFDTFSLFGNILSCKVATTPDGKSKGYGFVQFENEEVAKEAIQRVNGVKVGDKEVEVYEFEKRKEEQAAEEAEKGKGFKNLYVKSFPKDWDEAKLKEVFGAYGELTGCTKKEDWKQRPFAFADFANVEDAQKCVEEMHLKEMRSAEQVEEDTKSAKTMEKDQEGHPLHLLFVGKMQSKAERAAEWAKKDGGKASKGDGKGEKGGWAQPGWGNDWGKGGKKGGKPMWNSGMMNPMMNPMMPPMMMGGKGKPMVANPQQMMAVMSMMGKGPAGKGPLGPPMPMMKGMPMGGKGPAPPPQPPSDMGPPINSQALSGLPPPVQKQMIGERLYRQISRYQPDLAAKLTGMMLEMDNSELLMLLESEMRLKKQIDQALGVLKERQ